MSRRIVGCLAGVIILVVTLAGQNPAGRAGTIDITVSEGTSMALALSPDRQTIAIDLQGGLWTVPIKGGAAKRIIDEYYDARQPAWSPDGRSIAFQAYRDGSWRIWTVAPDGTGAAAITPGPFDDREPHWSPDGARIAFSSDRSGNYDIWMLDVKNRQVTQVTRNPANDFTPTWSPDGKWIAFTSNTAFKQGETYFVAAEGGTPRKLLDRSFGPGFATWSADGKTVIVSTLKAYSSRYREGMNYMMALPIDGGKPRMIVPVEHKPVGKRSGDGPVWSPDGKQMAFVSDGLLHVMPVGATGDSTGPPRAITKELADSPSWEGPNQILYIATDRLKLVSVADGATRDVPIDLTWTPKMPTGRIVVHAGRLVDGTKPTARTDVDIVIQGHRITSIEAHRADLHSQGTLVDATGRSVMPGLIEAHGHAHKEHGEAFGRILLSYGITTVRSPGGHPYEAVEEREAIDSGRRPGPRLFMTGYLLDGARPYYPMASSATNEAVVDMEVERARRLEYDLLKTYVRLPDLMQKRAIEGAHKIGIPVSSHEIYPSALSGVDSVEHTGATSRRGYSPKQSSTGRSYEDVIQIIAKSQMTITPTAALGGFQRLVVREPELANDPRTQLFPQWARDTMRPAGQQQGRGGRGQGRGGAQGTNAAFVTIKALHQAGARIIAGTDSPLVPYGISLHGELEDYVAAGLTPFQALQTATVNPARLLAAEADLGTIQVGKLADLVVVDGDPLADIKAARRVRTVIKTEKTRRTRRRRSSFASSRGWRNSTFAASSRHGSTGLPINYILDPDRFSNDAHYDAESPLMARERQSYWSGSRHQNINLAAHAASLAAGHPNSSRQSHPIGRLMLR